MGKTMEATRRAVNNRQPRRARPRPVALRQFLGISQEEFARLIGVSLRTVARWESEGVQPAPEMREQMDFLLKLGKKLDETIDRKRISDWFITPNPEFMNQPPIDLIHSKFGRRVIEQEIKRAEWGIPG